MQILEDLQNEIKELRKEINDVKVNTTKLSNIKPIVNIDTTEVAKKTSESFDSKFNSIKSQLERTEEVVKNVPRSIEIMNEVWGFTSIKAFFVFLTVIIISLLSNVYIYINYRESETAKRLESANYQSKEIKRLIEEWKEKNPKDSKSLYNSVNIDAMKEY